MKILVMGGGGREHAIVRNLVQGTDRKIFCMPGNGGISDMVECVIFTQGKQTKFWILPGRKKLNWQSLDRKSIWRTDSLIC